MVAQGNLILKFDYSAEEPINCLIHKLIHGIQLVGIHDGEVTDLSMCQWMTTHLASASTVGMVQQNLMIHLVINKNMNLLEGIQRVSALQFWMRLPLVYINIEK